MGMCLMSWHGCGSVAKTRRPDRARAAKLSIPREVDAELAPQEQEGQGGGRGEEAHEEGHEGAEGHRRHVPGGHQEEEVAEGDRAAGSYEATLGLCVRNRGLSIVLCLLSF